MRHEPLQPNKNESCSRSIRLTQKREHGLPRMSQPSLISSGSKVDVEWFASPAEKKKMVPFYKKSTTQSHGFGDEPHWRKTKRHVFKMDIAVLTPQLRPHPAHTCDGCKKIIASTKTWRNSLKTWLLDHHNQSGKRHKTSLTVDTKKNRWQHTSQPIPSVPLSPSPYP